MNVPLILLALAALPVLTAAFSAAGQTTSGPTFEAVVPNLVVSDIEKSLAFYRDALGFELDMWVPDAPPYVFVSVKRGAVQIFLNDRDTVRKDFPALARRPLGGGNTMYVRMTGIEAYHEQVRTRAPIVVPFVRQPYGMTEFGVEDPDGYILFFAQEG